VRPISRTTGLLVLLMLPALFGCSRGPDEAL